MTGTKTHLTAEQAPCGRLGDADRSQEDDFEGFRFDDVQLRLRVPADAARVP